MIKKPRAWESVQAFGSAPKKLPLGAYVVKIKQAILTDGDNGNRLNLLFDISEGEFKGYYTSQYQQNKQQFENVRWKGIIRLWCPLDDGTEQDTKTKRIFKGFVTALEDSNPGWTWDWTENSLTGKTLGILYRNEEYDYNGYHGWSVRPFRAMSAEKVREGDFDIPADKPLNNSHQAAPAAHYSVLPDEDEDLPF